VFEFTTGFLEMSLGLSARHYSLIGSAGKKDYSGDIDIAVSKNVLCSMYDEKLLPLIIRRRVRERGYEAEIISSGDIVSILYPIWPSEDEFVQIDLMISPNLEFSRWIFYAPNESESDWSGKYRNILLSSIVSVIKQESIETKDERVITWSKLMLHYTHGLHQATQTIKGKTKLLKNPKTIEKRFLTSDPKEITTILFGDSYSPEDVMTFENVWRIISSPSYIHSDKFVEIMKVYSLNATSISGYGYFKI
jgi:hypothetical protein